ncbi:MAG: MFS transporter [Bdellovibrionia bacterium]
MLLDFKKLMSARFLFTFGVQMQAVIIGWRMYDLTHDPLHLGLIGLAEAIPALSLALYAGYVVDRSRPLRVYKWVLRGSLLSALVLLVSSLGMGQLSLSAQVGALFLSSLITGFARGFSQPALFAAVPRIVPRSELPKASAWMTSALQIARISGPGLGGLIYGWFGVGATAGLISVILVAAIISMGLIEADPEAPQVVAKKNVRQELFSGVSFVFRHPILLPALSLDMISVFFGDMVALLPIFAAEILFVGPKGLGVLRAAPAVGAAIASYLLTRVNLREKAGNMLMVAVTGFGACILVFALSHSFYLSLAVLALSGAFDSVSMVIRGAAVQLVSPDHMRGRISAVNSIFIGSSNELGQFESGVAAKLLGTVPSVLFGGAVCLLTVGATAVLSPTLRKMNLDELEAKPL